MTYILLLRLSAPMQSWGVMSRFSRRDTGKEPSKSGVIGLLCAALGISRDEANTTNAFFAELINLKMGVRVIREGTPEWDFHTATDVIKSDGTTSPKPKHPKFTVISERHYLADADFVVGLESEKRETLEIVQKALQSPKWQLFLGRKAFVPDLPVYFREGIFAVGQAEDSLKSFLQSNTLDETLQKYDEELGSLPKKGSERIRLIIESPSGSETRQDVPLSFADRRFTNRRVKTEFINLKGEKDDGNLSDEDNSESAIAQGLD